MLTTVCAFWFKSRSIEKSLAIQNPFQLPTVTLCKPSQWPLAVTRGLSLPHSDFCTVLCSLLYLNFCSHYSKMSTVLLFLFIQVYEYTMCLKRLSVGEKCKQGPPLNSMSPSTQCLKDFFGICCHASLAPFSEDTHIQYSLLGSSCHLPR